MREMLPAVVCFVSVLCTASLASFGMDAAASALSSTNKASGGVATVTSAAEEDVVRVVGDDDMNGGVCLMFHELFAAVAILVSIVYYAVVKLTLVGMGAVIMAPPNPHPLYNEEEEEEEESDKKSDGTFSAVSSSSSSSSGEEVVYDAAADAADAKNEMALVVHATPAAFPASDEIEEVEPASPPHSIRPPRQHNHHVAVIAKEKKEEEEHFNSVKIWTNVYGLSIGIYCLVYSLLLPNELSAFVFCVISLLAGVHETVTPCLQTFLMEEEYEILGEPHRRKRRMKDWRRNAKRCLGWVCLFQSSVASEIKEAAASSLRRSKARARRMMKMMKSSVDIKAKKGLHETTTNEAPYSIGSGLIGSGVLVMPCLILALGLGLACKVVVSNLFHSLQSGWIDRCFFLVRCPVIMNAVFLVPSCVISCTAGDGGCVSSRRVGGASRRGL